MSSSNWLIHSKCSIFINRHDCSKFDSSTLQWPQHTLPGPTAWKQWSEMITWLNIDPNTSIINQPLGQWLSSFKMDYKWHWHICPQQHILFRSYDDTTWYMYHPHQWCPNHITYLNRPSITTKPSKMVPVTPSHTNFATHPHPTTNPWYHPTKSPDNDKSLTATKINNAQGTLGRTPMEWNPTACTHRHTTCTAH